MTDYVFDLEKVNDAIKTHEGMKDEWLSGRADAHLHLIFGEPDEPLTHEDILELRQEMADECDKSIAAFQRIINDRASGETHA